MLDYVTIRRCILTVTCVFAVQAGVGMVAPPARAAESASGAAGAGAPTATPPHAASPAPPAGSAAAPTAAELHALGVLLSRQLGSFELSESEFRSVAQGFADGFQHPDTVTPARAYVSQLQALEQARAAVAEQREEHAGVRYVSRAAALPHARKTASGMVYLPLAQGSGATPKLGDQVTVQYTGKLTDGSVFDSSAEHGGTATFTLGRVIPCWNEGLQLMKVGGRARLVCPSGLAYSTHGAGGVIPPGATLDFDVQLLAVKAGPPPTAQPTPH
jgi:FKBP-type peptidyl-prolyl cis-trans isomerase FkpA